MRPDRSRRIAEVLASEPERHSWQYNLEVCLLFNEAAIEKGALSARTIALARAGGFVLRGCVNWHPPRWWDELRRADREPAN